MGKKKSKVDISTVKLSLVDLQIAQSKIAEICTTPVEELQDDDLQTELVKLLHLLREEQFVMVYEARSKRYEALLNERWMRSRR